MSEPQPQQKFMIVPVEQKSENNDNSYSYNSIVKYAKESYQLLYQLTGFNTIKNPFLNLIIAYIIFDPLKVWEFINTTYLHAKEYSVIGLRNTMAFINHKPMPKLFTTIILDKDIASHKSNTLFIALEYFISTIDDLDSNKLYLYNLDKPDDNTIKTHEPIIKLPISNDSKFNFLGCTWHFVRDTEIVSYYESGKDEIKKSFSRYTLSTYDLNVNTFKNKYQKLTQELIDNYSKHLANKNWVQKIFSHNEYKWTDTPITHNNRDFNSVILPNETSEKLEKILTSFINNEDWYIRKGIPYKLTLLLYGPPGTGKTSIIKAISNITKRHIHQLNIGALKNDNELNSIFKSIGEYNKTIIAIEDIDVQTNVVKHRNITSEKKSEKQSTEPPITLSNILQLLCGANEHHGRIMIITTNDISSLDDALMRPGRIDHKIFLDYANNEQILKMFRYFYEDKLTLTSDDLNKIKCEQYKENTPKNEFMITPAEIECILKEHHLNQQAAYETILNPELRKTIDYKYTVSS